MKNLLILLLAAGCGLLWLRYQNKCDELAAANERLEQQQAAAAKAATVAPPAQAEVSAVPGATATLLRPAASPIPKKPDWFQKQIDQARQKTKGMSAPE